MSHCRQLWKLLCFVVQIIWKEKQHSWECRVCVCVLELSVSVCVCVCVCKCVCAGVCVCVCQSVSSKANQTNNNRSPGLSEELANVAPHTHTHAHSLSLPLFIVTRSAGREELVRTLALSGWCVHCVHPELWTRAFVWKFCAPCTDFHVEIFTY